MAGYKRVRGGLERALKAARAAGTLQPHHEAVVAAARAVADRMDEDLPGDNVSASIFLRYMSSLGMTVVADRKAQGHEVAPKDKSKLEELQERVQAAQSVKES